MNKKIFMVGVLLLAVCITISAVSADEGFNFSFSSSDSSNSDGDSIKFDNGKLVIQGIEFAIPDGYKEVDNAKVLGGNDSSFPGFKVSSDTFAKGNDNITVKVIYSDTTEGNYTPNSNATEKTINKQAGWFNEDNGKAVFTYIKDRKVVAIIAPDENTIASIIK